MSDFGQFCSIHRFTVNPFQENTYLIIKGQSAIVIDPGFSSSTEMKPFLEIVARSGAVLHAVVLTHAHIDHILGIERILAHFPGIPVVMHELEKMDWDRAPAAAMMFGLPLQMSSITPQMIQTGTPISFGEITLQTRFVPGHAPGHILLIPEQENVVFSGDTVFYRSIGRTDLPGGSSQTLLESIRTQIFTLDEGTILLPGHGPETTVGDEKRLNPYVGSVR